MDSQLKDLFVQFNLYLEKLRRDLARIAARMPANRRAAFEVPDYDYETFCERWNLLIRDDALLRKWRQRLSSKGYETEQARIRNAISDSIDRAQRRRAKAA